MNILSVGNSFSTDAQRYLHKIAKADGVRLETCNLYIGACSLERHCTNIHSGEDVYDLEINGESTGRKISLKDALVSRQWDIVTVQQASHVSTNYDNYMPYLEELVCYIKTLAPGARIALHETWAYEEGSDRLTQDMGYAHQSDMYNDVKNAYRKAKEDIKPEYFIPSGTLLQSLLASGIEKVHRDTFHLSLGLGRYAVALLWYATLTGNDVANNTFSDFDEEVSKEETEIVKRCVTKVKGECLCSK